MSGAPAKVRDWVRGLDPQRGALHNAERALHHLHRDIADRAELQRDGRRRVVPLSTRETVDLLRRQSVGRLAYVSRADVPDVVPVNYRWYDGAVLIRSGPGPKLQAAQRRAMVALEVDELDVETRTAWSAVVYGRAEVLAHPEAVADVDVWASGPRQHVIRIVPTRITGRRLGD